MTRTIAIPLREERPQEPRGESRASGGELPLRFPAKSSQETPAGEDAAPVAAALAAGLAAGPASSLWELDITEVAGHNLEARGRDAVNRMLEQGWRLLHIYTLRYREDQVWRERPMAILGRPRARNERPQESLEAAPRGGSHENPAGRG